MTTIASVASLLADAALPADLDAVVQQGAAGVWDLVFNDGRIVEATLLEDAGLVVLETDLGVPATRDLAALHRLLLHYNYLWRETGGLRVSLDSPRDSAFLAYTLPASGPDATLVANMLGNFHAAATAWAESLARPDSSGFDPLASGVFTGAIRA